MKLLKSHFIMKNLVFEKMHKAYAGVPALSDVTLKLDAGRVHALMGENGAGKSTLIKLAAGVVDADNLVFRIDDDVTPLNNAQDAHNAGLRFIHQELNIVPQVSVAENILLGRAFPRNFLYSVDWKELKKKATDALNALGAGNIDVSALAGSLSTGDKMMIKIAAALVAEDGNEAICYVFDEPTAALTNAESEMLFSVIETLKSNGAAILYVSHRMDEVLRLCDDVTVLRDGKHVSTKEVKDTNKDEIILAMTGREVKDAYPARDKAIEDDVVVSLNNVSSNRLSGLNVDIRRGEILGVSGLAEAGQTELLNIFMGLEKPTSGSVEFNTDKVPDNPNDAWAKGVAYIPKERRTESLMLDMSIRANTVLPHLGEYGFKANKKDETEKTKTLAEKVRLKYQGTEQPVGQLSGGNQQKVVFARVVCGNPKLLLLDEPTRGVDVGAKYDIYLLVRELSALGCTVILNSTDLPETLGMCDRILVLNDGEQSHLLESKELTPAGLLSKIYLKGSK